VDITFRTDKLADECNNTKSLIRRYGADNARRIRRCLDDLHAAVNLEIMRLLPGRCHELRGDLAGRFAIDLRHPYRLIFEPSNEPIPYKADGGIDWSGVTIIRILRIEDYHG
jgi:toxin HigB-1